MLENDKNDLVSETEQIKEENVAPKATISSNDFYDDEVLNRPRPKKDNFSVSAINLNLDTPQRKGFLRQWVIDREISAFEKRDWKPVKGQDGNPMRAVMNRNTKEVQYGTYMEIPEHYYQENIKLDDEARKEVLIKRMPSKEGSTIDGEAFVAPSDITNKIESNKKV